jgi:hypothetical protein
MTFSVVGYMRFETATFGAGEALSAHLVDLKTAHMIVPRIQAVTGTEVNIGR